MPKKEIKGEQATVRIGKDLLRAVRGFLNTEEAKSMGLDSDKDVVQAAVMEFLKETGYYQRVFGASSESGRQPARREGQG